MSNFENKTVDKIFNELYKIALDKFKLTDISLSKSGVTGFLLYALAYLNEDARGYYEFLYNESNPLSAKTYESLLKWGALFGYPIQYATPAIFIGNILVYIPKGLIDPNNPVVEIKIPYLSQFYIDDVVYTSFVDTTIISDFNIGKIQAVYYDIENQQFKNYLGSVINETDKYILISVPAYGIKQIEIDESILNVPYYPPQTYFEIPLNYDTESYQLANLKAYIKLPSENEFYPAKLDSVRYIYGSNDRVIFISQKDRNKYSLFLPNGIHGMYLPQSSEVKVVKYLTKGAAGNIAKNVYLKSKLNIPIYINGEVVTDENVIQLLSTVDIKSGVDVKSFEEIKKDIIKIIRTKNTLITLDDFVEFGGLNKNNLYVYNLVDFIHGSSQIIFSPLLLDNGMPVQSITLTLQETEFNPNNDFILVNPTYIKTLNNKILTDEYTVTQTAAQGDTTIHLNTVNNLNVGDTLNINGTEYQISSIDTSNNSVVLSTPLAVNLNSGAVVYKVENERIKLVSPFIYVKNKNRNSYDVFFINNEKFEISISEIYNENVTSTVGEFPNIEISITNIYYDTTTAAPYVTITADILNSQNLKNNPIIKIQTVNGKTIELNETNNFTANVKITDLIKTTNNDTITDILDELNDITVVVNVLDEITSLTLYTAEAHINYLSNVTSSLKIFRYYDSQNNVTYVAFIPFISEDQYITFKNVIKNKIKDVLNSLNAQENRLISAAPRLSFPNTIELEEPSYFLQKDPTKEECVYTNIRFPIKVSITLVKSNNTSNQITNSDVTTLKMELAKYLKSKQGFIVNLPITELTDFIKKMLGNKISDVKINSPAASLISRQDFETYYLQSKYSTDKLIPLKYNPPYFNFDLDNIDITIV